MCIKLLNIQGIVRNLLKRQKLTKDHLLTAWVVIVYSQWTKLLIKVLLLCCHLDYFI